MSSSGHRSSSNGGPADTRADARDARDARSDARSSSAPALYFFPDREVTEEELREILARDSSDSSDSSDSGEDRAWAISHLLRYAQWEDIWTYVDRDEVREIFPDLDLPENLRAAWGRMLKIETPVG